MARIIGGIGTSHVPTIGVAYDKKKDNDPAWAPMFQGYVPVAKWLAEKKPDVTLIFFNDHASSFFFDLYPTFAVGVAEEFEVADEGAGKRPFPPIKGNFELSAHIAEQLVNDEFDIATFSGARRADLSALLLLLALAALAAAGIGTIGLVDDDVVDETNLQRQVLYGTSTLGRPKHAAARERLAHERERPRRGTGHVQDEAASGRQDSQHL